MFNKKFTGFILTLLVLLSSSVLMAEQPQYRGKVLKLNGEVELVNANGETRLIEKADEALYEMDTIVTKAGAFLVVQFDDGTLSVLDEKSRLRIERSRWYSYLGGKIYFNFKRAFGEQRRVKTRAAVIGVRNAIFIIDENDERNNESVALQEGLLEVLSTGPVFEIHKQRVSHQFKPIRRVQENDKDEFETYRQRMRREFVEYRRQFLLRPNRVISLSGYRVDETAMTEVKRADFLMFEAEADALIKMFQAQPSS